MQAVNDINMLYPLGVVVFALIILWSAVWYEKMQDIVNKLLHWQYLKFALVGTCGTLVSAGILYSLTTYFQLYYMLSFIVGAVAGSIVNYLLSKYWVFKNG